MGKFAQRAGVKPEDQTLTKEDAGEHGYHALLSYDFARKYVPSDLLPALSGVLFHHRSDIEDPDIRIIQIADHLAASERRVGSEEREDPENARLIPILTTVTLKDTVTPSDYRYRLKPLIHGMKRQYSLYLKAKKRTVTKSYGMSLLGN